MAWHRAGFSLRSGPGKVGAATPDDLSFQPLRVSIDTAPVVTSQSLIVLDEPQLAAFTIVNHYCIV